MQIKSQTANSRGAEFNTIQTLTQNNSQSLTGPEPSSSLKLNQAISTQEDGNIFQAYFTEMNERTHETMSSNHPEPERALEYLKQVEDFIHKIEKAKKMVKK